MNANGYRQAIADYVRANARPPDKFSHQPRLYQLSRQLAEGRSFDDDVLYAAAWMHDLGVFIGHRPEDPAALAAWDMLVYASQKVPPLLQQFGFPAPTATSCGEACGSRSGVSAERRHHSLTQRGFFREKVSGALPRRRYVEAARRKAAGSIKASTPQRTHRNDVATRPAPGGDQRAHCRRDRDQETAWNIAHVALGSALKL